MKLLKVSIIVLLLSVFVYAGGTKVVPLELHISNSNFTNCPGEYEIRPYV